MLVHDGVSEPIQPGPGIQILPPGSRFGKGRPVGVSHDDHPQGRVVEQGALGPLPLADCGPIETRGVPGGVGQPVAHLVRQPESDRRMQGPVGSNHERIGGHGVQQPGRPMLFRDPVTMDRQDPAGPDLELGAAGMELDLQVLPPEVAAPAIVIPAGHDDGDPLAERREPCGDMKPAAGNYPLVFEPEIEQIPVDQQGIAQGGDGLQEGEQGRLDLRRSRPQVGIGQNHELMAKHRGKIAHPRSAASALSPNLIPGLPFGTMCPANPPSRHHPSEPGIEPAEVSEISVRVNYSETDQMGVVYHARYVVWLDMARTEHLRHAGMSYKEVEAMGVRLAVGELAIRYRQPARYDDQVRIRCWVRELGSRRILFGYAIENAETNLLLATATTAMFSINAEQRPTRLPDQVMRLLRVTPDPVRI
jgi:acyl-CoA thioester hydrolase